MKYLFALFISLPTLANLSGSFSGPGSAVYHSGKRYECSEIFLRLKTDNDFFRLQEGGYICGFLKASFDSFRLSIKEGKLFHEDRELGTISPEGISYSVFDSADGSTYTLTLSLKTNGEIFYDEKWHDGHKLALKVKGHLRRISD